MPTNIERAGMVARQVELLSVSLQQAVVHSNVDPLDPPEQLQLRQGYQAHYELSDKRPDQLHVSVALDFSAADSAEEAAEEHAALSATFRLVYALNDASEQPPDALQHFAELNGVYNVWPYWRELVQTVSGRIGLASIVIPVFRPVSRDVEDATGGDE